ncbi:hypothetical protein CMEL01_04582 [Colletotrichum melonis]|uniref:Uncharacterized protein n=1 Tax=Colletotrichum melonis TaxID=1209925 RepID=A0AAI9UEK2_9PEZI|nr:hypothetical protein CMEL01_04582 [Colletotrichum melonis]
MSEQCSSFPLPGMDPNPSQVARKGGRDTRLGSLPVPARSCPENATLNMLDHHGKSLRAGVAVTQCKQVQVQSRTSVTSSSRLPSAFGSRDPQGSRSLEGGTWPPPLPFHSHNAPVPLSPSHDGRRLPSPRNLK